MSEEWVKPYQRYVDLTAKIQDSPYLLAFILRYLGADTGPIGNVKKKIGDKVLIIVRNILKEVENFVPQKKVPFSVNPIDLKIWLDFIGLYMYKTGPLIAFPHLGYF
jgi:hypothetical protein